MRIQTISSAFLLLSLAACGPEVPNQTPPQTNAPPDKIQPGRTARFDTGLADAALPDAALPDAALPDAALPDAALPDAALPDMGPSLFAPGPYGHQVQDIAGPFVLPTTTGELDFEADFNGDEIFIFTFYSLSEPATHALWQSDVGSLIDASPNNVHYVFLAFGAEGFDVAARVNVMERRLLQHVHTLSEAKQAHWLTHLHFVPRAVQDLEGWLSDAIEAQPTFVIGIDTRQRRRQVGNLSAQAEFTPELKRLAYAARGFNFEQQQDDWVAGQQIAEHTLAIQAEHPEGDLLYSGDLRVQFILPEPDQMAAYDKLFVEFDLRCTDRLEQNCAETAAPISLTICDQPINRDPAAVCRPALGDVPAEMRSCQCSDPHGAVVDLVQDCRADGQGFDPCPCTCETEIARWVTPLRREGHWITDISQMLVHLQAGGRFEMRLGGEQHTEEINMVDLTLHLSDDHNSAHPTQMIPLFSGGPFDEGYNARFEEITFTVPPNVFEVYLHTFLAGYGGELDGETCAAFCDHQHQFTVNEVPFEQAHPEAVDAEACAEQIEHGVVPNQYGEWAHGRAGWCPGQQIAPHVIDLTDVITIGDNTIRYQALVDGLPYSPAEVGDARIDMSSAIIIWTR